MRPFVLAILMLATGSVAFGQKFDWVGQSVVMKYPTAITVDGKIVDNGTAHRVYKVKRVDGTRLLVAAGPVAGWIDKSSMVLADNAIDFYTQEIKRNPQNILAYNLRGINFHNRGEHDRAIEDYTESIRLNPNNGFVHNNRGLIYNLRKQYDLALADFDEAIQLDGPSAMTLVNRGRTWLMKHDFDQAILDFGEALRIDPRNSGAYSGRGAAWHNKGQYDLAFADFNFGIGFDSSNSRLYFQRSLIYKQRTEHEKAIADLDEALRLDPQYGMAYNHRGQAHALRKEYELALADFDQAIRFEPGADAYNQKAWLLATCPDDKLRNGQTAIELATKACQLTDWKNAGWIDTLAAAYAEVGDFDKAVEMQERALKGVNSKARKEFEARLELYREHKPYRE